MPKPKYIFVWNEPDILHDRNQKHPKSDQERQLKRYFELKEKYWMIIKTDSFNIIDDIMKKLEKSM